MKVIEYLSRRSRTSFLLMGLAGVSYVALLDYATGTVAMLVFYLFPICFVSWFGGRLAGVSTACAAATAWYIAKLVSPDVISSQFWLLWNFLMRLGVFAVTALLTTEVAERKRIEEALRRAHEGLEGRVRERTMELGRANAALQAEVAERTRAERNLKLLNETLEERVAQRSAVAEERARELARSESTLRRQTGILQSILNSMGDGVIVADAQGSILLYNPMAERLMEAGIGRVAPAQWLEELSNYLPEMLTTYPTSAHPLLRAIRGEVITGAEVFLRRSIELEGVWVAATGRPLINEKGVVQGGVVVLADITQRKLLEKQIAEISDREQRRIGQDLHDSLCQHLVSVAFAGELLRQNLSRRQLAEAAQAEAIVEMVNEGISEARNLARGLYPVRLEVDGLASALEELAATVEARTGIACRSSCDEAVCIFDQVAGSNLYRIAQEAVNNAIKHGGCSNISIGLGAVEDEVTLTVKDDGVGFPEAKEDTGGMGLLIMSYRARMIGASLDIRRGAGGGTIVICSFHNDSVVEHEHVQSSKT